MGKRNLSALLTQRGRYIEAHMLKHMHIGENAEPEDLINVPSSQIFSIFLALGCAGVGMEFTHSPICLFFPSQCTDLALGLLKFAIVSSYKEKILLLLRGFVHCDSCHLNCNELIPVPFCQQVQLRSLLGSSCRLP